MINSENIIQNVVRKFDDIGIDKEINGEESHTVKLVRAIVEETIKEIVRYGELRVDIVNTTVTVSGPTGVGVGSGRGLPGSIS